MTGAARDAGVPLVGDCEGGMFGFFFADTLPQSCGALLAKGSDTLNRFLLAMLQRGAYLAPAMYDAGSVSAARSADDLAATVQAASEALRA